MTDPNVPSVEQVRAASVGQPTHAGEPHAGFSAGRLNWLRAGVLGANDGIVSVAGIVVGVASASSARGPIFTAGLAGLVAGAVSMALGEYVSVSSQRDSENAQLAQERRELAETPEQELAELTAIYEAKGLTAETARRVAGELTEHDALAAHIDAELNLDPDDLANPIQAAGASALSFTLGAVLPILAILLPPRVLARSGDLRRGPGGAGCRRVGQCATGRQQRPTGCTTGGDRRCGRSGRHLCRRPSSWHGDQLAGPPEATRSIRRRTRCRFVQRATKREVPFQERSRHPAATGPGGQGQSNAGSRYGHDPVERIYDYAPRRPRGTLRT